MEGHRSKSGEGGGGFLQYPPPLYPLPPGRLLEKRFSDNCFVSSIPITIRSRSLTHVVRSFSFAARLKSRSTCGTDYEDFKLFIGFPTASKAGQVNESRSPFVLRVSPHTQPLQSRHHPTKVLCPFVGIPKTECHRKD